MHDLLVDSPTIVVEAGTDCKRPEAFFLVTKASNGFTLTAIL